MQEIWIAELLICFFLFLHITRPVIKALQSIEGLAWLPLVALLISLALFPAYGFRPELIPLLLFAAFFTGAGIFSRIRENAGSRVYRKTRAIFVAVPLALLFIFTGIAFYFTPPKDTAFLTQGVYTLKAEDTSEEKAAEYYIRVYTESGDLHPSSRPLLILAPPLLGSIMAVDQISGELRDRGFTVISYSRRGFDTPAIHISEGGKTERHGIGMAEWFRRFNAFSSGTVSAKANAYGCLLEEKRKEDIQFLLSWIRQNPLLDEKIPLFSIASRDAVFLAGYDAGGSALVLLADSFSGINISGLIAIESPLWSVYRADTPEIPPLSADAGWLESVRYSLNRWFQEMKPRKITGLGQVPVLSIPVLFLTSDRERDFNYQETSYTGSRYLALHRCFEAARFPSVLASADGAGPLDYSDFPVRYPLITAFFGGHQRTHRDNIDAPAGTAAIITNFAIRAAGGGAASALKSAPLPEGIRFTYR